MLSDAQSFIEEFPLPSDTLTRAILDLRYAEVKGLRIATVRGLGEIIRFLLAPDKTKSGLLGLHTLRPERAPKPEEIKVMLREIEDAIKSLSRSESLLQQHRKNHWWWHLLIVLKLKACEYVLVCRLLLKQGQHIPGSSFEGLFESVDRMIVEELPARLRSLTRYDSFQTARLAETYVNIIRLLGALKDEDTLKHPSIRPFGELLYERLCHSQAQMEAEPGYSEDVQQVLKHASEYMERYRAELKRLKPQKVRTGSHKRRRLRSAASKLARFRKGSGKLKI